MSLQDEGAVNWMNQWTLTECLKKSKRGMLKEAFASAAIRRGTYRETAPTKANSDEEVTIGETAETLKLASELYSTNYHPKRKPNSLTQLQRRIFNRARQGDAVRAR